MKNNRTNSDAELNNDITEEGSVIKKPERLADCNKDVETEVVNSDDPRTMLKYHFNLNGLPLSLLLICYYCYLLVKQFKSDLPTIQHGIMRYVLKISYMGYLTYFISCLLHKRFAYECRNAEGLVLFSGILQIYYILNNLPADKSFISVVETVFSVLLPVCVACACYARRTPKLKMWMNPWLKDKSDLIKIIHDSKRRASTIDL